MEMEAPACDVVEMIAMASLMVGIVFQLDPFDLVYEIYRCS